MAVVCQACGAENRGGVPSCRLCATPLNPGAGQSPRGHRLKLARDQAQAALAPEAATGIPRWLLGIGVAAAILGLVGARAVMSPTADAGAMAAAPVVERMAPAPVDAPPASLTEAPGHNLEEATAAAEARLQASLERLAREDRERSEAQARRAAERARLQEEAEAALAASQAQAQMQAAAQPSPNRPSGAGGAVARSPSTASGGAAAAAVPATMTTVTQRCADSGNFLSRSMCERRVCDETALAQDPVCRRLREQELANRRDPYLLN